MRIKFVLGLILAGSTYLCGCNFPQETKMEPVNSVAKETAAPPAAADPHDPNARAKAEGQKR